MSSLPQLSYEIGEYVWIDVCCQGRVLGVVIGEFRLVDDPATKYIIRVLDPEYPHEEVRDALLMAPNNEPMPYTETRKKPEADHRH